MKNTGIQKATNPIDNKEEVKQSNDKHIDQDFKNFPSSPAGENIINPKTKADKLTADTENKNPGKPNPAKKKAAKAGDTTSTEKKLAEELSGTGKKLPNATDRLKKQKK